MIRPRYLATLYTKDIGDTSREEYLISAAKRHLGPEPATLVATQGVVIYIGDSFVASGPEFKILIIGTLFRSEGMGRVRNFDEAEARAIIATRGGKLVRNYWGAYVAFLFDEEANHVSVVRDPSGGLPCYFRSTGSSTTIGSDIQIIFSTDANGIRVNWEEISSHLQASQLRRRKTCIDTLQELLWGESLTIKDSVKSINQLWSPWTFAEDRRQIVDQNEASELLRQTIVGCVRSLATPHQHILLTLSGGLDSSIVAAALATVGACFTSLTMATEEPAGDERYFARLVSKATGGRLVERFESLDAVDLSVCQGSHLPRPIARAFAQSIDRASADVAADVGTDSYFTGAGGDNVFCFLLSAAPAADHLRRGRLLHALLTVRDLAKMGENGMPSVLFKAMRRAWLRKPGFQWQRDITMLSERALRLGAAAIEHPWLIAPSRAQPGKAGHIASLMNIQNHLEGFCRELDRPVIAPLLAQPIVELCLRIPASIWCTDGRDRYVARAAFADRLPQEILERRDKGTPDGFAARLFDHNREQINEMLTRGRLSEAGLLDVPAIESITLASGPPMASALLRVLKILDVEMWLRSIVR